VRIANRVGGPRGIALASLAMAQVALASDQFSDARDFADDAIVESQRARRLHEQAMARSIRSRACLGMAGQGTEGALVDAESEARLAVQVADRTGAVRERSITRLTLARVLAAAGRPDSAEAVLDEIVRLLQSGAATLSELLGDIDEVPLLLRSPAADIERVFSDKRVDAPAIEWEARALQGRTLPEDRAIEPLRIAATALTRLLAGLTAEDAVRYGKANPDTDIVYKEFSRIAATEEDRRQLRVLAERAALGGGQADSPLTAISGKS
jgi:ATP/maltotriose-dependent transcriptional regulator MalT